MSEGPIKRARDAWLPPQVSTKNSERICGVVGFASYCGRPKTKMATNWGDVTCADCRAAYRADGGVS